ncbi:hypothetical protein JCM11491_003732, partial [Sporobolomyces phaffii]
MALTLASIALSIPAIVSLIVDYLVADAVESRSCRPGSDARLAQLPAYYAVLCSHACISRAFSRECETVLASHVVFVHGTPQLSQYLDSVAARLGRTKRKKTKFVSFLDPLPFKVGVKWDLDAVKNVLGRLEGCERLNLGFMGQDKLPVEWLALENLKSVRCLQLGSPLGALETSPRPSFTDLTVFAPVDQFPRLGRSWYETFAHLSSFPALRIAHLDLSHFPSFATYLVPSLYPFASSLSALSLPSLDASALFVFFQACTSLKSVSVAHLAAASSPSLCYLLVLPDTVASVSFGSIVGSVAGDHDWTPAGHASDVVSRLADTLDDLAKSDAHRRLERVELGTVKWFLPGHATRFAQYSTASGVHVSIDEVDNSRTEAEVSPISLPP